MSPLTPAAALFAATFVSEDLACITAGLLIQRDEVGLLTGMLACTLGIFAGDVGLWAIGRGFGRVTLQWRWLRQPAALDDLKRWLDRHAAGAIVGSRFLPGTRLPLYVLSGVLNVPLAVFALWALIASVLWTPTLVLLTASLGDAFLRWLAPVFGLGWPARLAAAAGGLMLIRAVRLFATPAARQRTSARLARLRRWEFWPMWLFYAPVAMWIAYLAIRFRGIGTITAANPGMPDGGTVGESKADILERLPADVTIPFVRIPPADPAGRVLLLVTHMRTMDWHFPIVLKPDVGERGTGVKLIRSDDDAAAYLGAVTGRVVAQPYHPGPFEAGVFYYRMPAWPRGRIFSITDKHFPFIDGDGVSTVEELVWRHPRVRLQADVFLTRHQAIRAHVLERGARLQLAIAGNHAQGTLFRDGQHLITPALEARIDAIARSFDGFFVGRFDIRYGSVEAFKAGEDLAIVELNGATAESTNIYDPDTSLVSAYRQLFRQWWIVFAIGAANRRRGAAVSSLGRLRDLVRDHLATKPVFLTSD